MKKLITTIMSAVLALTLFAGQASALVDTVTISELPEYTNRDNFYLSYSALSGGPVSAQFSSRRDGDSYSAFGPVLNGSSGQVLVTRDELTAQDKFFFKVEINGGTAVDETSVFFDTSGPSPVNSYWREGVSPSHNRLHWRTPSDSDFSRVFVYRSESSEFTADGGTKVAEVGGAPDTDATWDDSGLDPNKDYFYALRAIDKAGNPSSLVSDVPETVITETTTTVAPGDGSGVVLPRSERSGEVLGDEDGDGDEEVGDERTIEELLGLGDDGLGEALGGGATGGRRVVTGLVTVAAVYIFYRVFFRRKK